MIEELTIPASDIKPGDRLIIHSWIRDITEATPYIRLSWANSSDWAYFPSQQIYTVKREIPTETVDLPLSFVKEVKSYSMYRSPASAKTLINELIKYLDQ